MNFLDLRIWICSRFCTRMEGRCFIMAIVVNRMNLATGWGKRTRVSRPLKQGVGGGDEGVRQMLRLSDTLSVEGRLLTLWRAAGDLALGLFDRRLLFEQHLPLGLKHADHINIHHAIYTHEHGPNHTYFVGIIRRRPTEKWRKRKMDIIFRFGNSAPFNFDTYFIQRS